MFFPLQILIYWIYWITNLTNFDRNLQLTTSPVITVVQSLYLNMNSTLPRILAENQLWPSKYFMRAGSSHGGQVLKSREAVSYISPLKSHRVLVGAEALKRIRAMLGVTNHKYSILKSVQKLQLFITRELAIIPLTVAIGQSWSAQYVTHNKCHSDFPNECKS